MSAPDWLREPTADECSAHAPIGEGFAIWYPQMGGYVGKAVVVPEQGVQVGDGGEIGPNSCFGVYVWHDGEFPFSAQYGDAVSPAYLHHCEPEQFVEFGRSVRERLATEIRSAP